MKNIAVLILIITNIIITTTESNSISLGRHTNDCSNINQYIINNIRKFYEMRAHDNMNILFIGDGGIVYNCFNINEEYFNLDLISDRLYYYHFNRLHTWGCHIEYSFNELDDIIEFDDIIWYIYIKDNTDSADADSCMIDFVNIYRIILSDEDAEHVQ